MLIMCRRRYRSPQQMVAPMLQPPAPQEDGTRGYRRGAEIRVRPRVARSKAFSGSRCPRACPRQRTRGRRGNRWRPLYPVGVVLGLRSLSMAVECGARRGPCLAI